ncbi:MAG: hypothetical protein P8181_17085, partial [bacterium]
MRRLVHLLVAITAAALVVTAGCGGAKEPAEAGGGAGHAGQSGAAAPTGDYVGQTPPGTTPKLFAPGFISTGLYERDVAMTPDGNELYFGLMSGGYVMIAVTKRVNGEWTRPEIAPFCSDPDAYDLEGCITPDGKR